MALINLTTVYTDLKWSQDGGVPHADYSQNSKPVMGLRKHSDQATHQQDLFYQANQGKLTGPLEGLTSSLTSQSYPNNSSNSTSQKPYVTSDSNGNVNFGNGTTINTSNTDQSGWPVRGGTYPYNKIDTERIKGFLKTPAGTAFIDKQKTLQFMNPKIETGASVLSSDTRQTLPGLVENTRVYSTDNLLGQIAIEGTGGHLARVGYPNFGIQDDFYAATVGMQNITNSAVNNRLALLQRLKISGGNANTFSSFPSLFASAADLLLAKKMGIATNGSLIYNYPGGPNSSFKDGSTIIRRSTDTTLNVLSNVMNYAQIANATGVQTGQVIDAITPNLVTYNNISDFRANTKDYKESATTWLNASVGLRTRLGESNPSSKSRQEKAKTYKTAVSPDQLNRFMPLITRDLNLDPYDNNEDVLKAIGAVKSTDIIKFGFECMSNDRPGDSVLLLFRAFLTNGFTDNNTAVLNSFRYAGRGEEFHTYQGFTRSISFSFKIVAFSRADMNGNYSKLNQLISQVYPDYSPLKNVMRAPVVKVTIGDYLYRVPGFLESVNVTVDNAHPWEIKLSEDETDVQQLPMILDVSISFKPIQNILPRRQTVETELVELISHDEYLWGPKKDTVPQPAPPSNNSIATPKTTPTPVATQKTGIIETGGSNEEFYDPNLLKPELE